MREYPEPMGVFVSLTPCGLTQRDWRQRTARAGEDGGSSGRLSGFCARCSGAQVSSGDAISQLQAPLVA